MRFFKSNTNKNKSVIVNNINTDDEKVNNELLYYKKELEKLKNENTLLENTIKQFTEHHDEYDEKLNIEKKILKEQFEKTLSKKKILEFVENLLKDKNINIGYLPDYVEKQLYLNIFTILMGIAEHSLKSIKIEVMGHQLDISITPVPITPISIKPVLVLPDVPVLQRSHKMKNITLDIDNSNLNKNESNLPKRRVSFI